MQNNYKILFYLSLITILIIFTDFTKLESIALFVFLFQLSQFVLQLNICFSISNVIGLICTFQWLIAPMIFYNLDFGNDYRYKMVVDKDTYFSFVLPATVLYLFPLHYPFNKLFFDREKILRFSQLEDTNSKGILFIIFGFIVSFIPGLGFLGYLLSSFKFTGAFYLLFSKKTISKFWIFIVFIVLLLSSLRSGMFHNLIIWGLFLALFLFIKYKFSFFIEIIILLIGFNVIFIIQGVKNDYRKIAWYENVETKERIGSFLDLTQNYINTNENIISIENVKNSLARFNQGWIVSHVMDYTSESQNYGNGESITKALEASFLPRILFPDKQYYIGPENMQRYANISLLEGVSMDIGQVSEGYANFGYFGGLLFMFALGLLLKGIIVFIHSKLNKFPELIFWVPLIFLQVIKAESSLTTVLNHLVKASIVTIIFFSQWVYQFLKKIKF